MNWIEGNLLSLYAAIVGTIALFLNFGRFWLMRQKSLRKLKVISMIDKSAQERLNELAKPKDVFSGHSALIGPIYTVSVINPSHIPLHIDDVGIIIKEKNIKKKIQALVRRGTHGFLSRVDEAGGEDISAGAKKTFSIWLSHENTQIPEIIGSYVVDQTGKEFKGKHNSNGEILTVPEIPTEEEPNKPLEPIKNPPAGS